MAVAHGSRRSRLLLLERMLTLFAGLSKHHHLH
jgi:hypothetical protein